jgi:hypothetical protein
MASKGAPEQIAPVDLSTVVFGLIEMRRARQEREERAAFVAVQAILTPAIGVKVSLERFLFLICSLVLIRRLGKYW